MKRGIDPSRLPCAYDLKKAKNEARDRGFRFKEAVACMHEGRVEVADSKEGKAWRDRRPKLRRLYNQWIRKIDFSLLLDIELPPFEYTAGERPEFVRCIACFDGWKWFAWEELEVSRALLNSAHLPPDAPRLGLIPLEFSIFDPDASDLVWAREEVEPVVPRAVDFARQVMFETASLYCQACRLLPDFEEVFRDEAGYRARTCTYPKCGCDVSDALDCVRPLPQELWKTAKLLRDNQQQAAALIEWLAMESVKRAPPRLDFATGLRQAFLMCRRLAQCGALLNAVADQKWTARHGKGKGFSRLAVLCASAEFKEKTSKEVFLALEGRKDPDHPKHVLRFNEAGELIRGNGETLKPKSFATRLSVWRKALSTN